MPLSRRRVEIAVGMLVIVGVAAMLLSVVFIGQQRRVFEARARIETEFRSVEGLQPGAPVQLAGILVGTVETISFTPEGRVRVVMEIRRSVLDRIHVDSKAHIKSAGLVGDKYIDITVGGAGQPVLQPGASLEGVEPLDFSRVLQEARPVLDNLATAIENMREVTGQLAEEDSDIGQTLANLREITDTLREGGGTIGRLIRDDAVYEDLRAAVASGKQAAQNAEAVTANAREEFPAVVSDARQAMQQFRSAAARVDKGLENLPEVMAGFERTIADLEDAMANLRDASADIKEATPQVPELLSSGQAVVDEARAVLEAARAHPLLRRYFEEEQLREPILVQDRVDVDTGS